MFQQTYGVHVFSEFLFNPLRPNPGYIQDFRKVLPFLLKSRFVLLSLRLHTKRVCGFDSPLNFEETGAKKSAIGVRPNVTKKLANSLFFSLNFC